MCNLFAKLGARGTSIIFSSGDSGPGGICASNDGTNTSKFQPTFPGACPWITSVGATEFVEVGPDLDTLFRLFVHSLHACKAGNCNWLLLGRLLRHVSGSKVPREGAEHVLCREQGPMGAVRAFLQQDGPRLPRRLGAGPKLPGQPRWLHLPGWRNLCLGTYFLGHHLVCNIINQSCCNNELTLASLVNDKRLSEGKSVLGFLNPALYRAAGTKAFNDITGGTSRGCGGSSTGVGSIPWAGWAAVKGWDPSTGLGTPNFEGLVENL